MNFLSEEFNFNVNAFENDNSGLKQAKKLEKRALKASIKFVNEFPINQIKNLSKEQYCIGFHGIEKYKNLWNKTFCYLIERDRDLMLFGSIRGANASKFGIYYRKFRPEQPTISEGYYCSETWENNNDYDSAFEKIKQSIHKLLSIASSGAQEDIFKEYRTSKISPMFKSKLLSVYFPEKYIHIHDENFIDNFLRQLGIKFDEHDDILTKKILLEQVKNSNAKTKKWSNFVFYRFLNIFYRNWDRIEAQENQNELKNLDINLISLIDSNNCNRDSNYIPDYQKANSRKMAIGNKGEKLALEWEIKRLKNENNRFWRKIKQISTSLPHAGYDILSYNQDGSELHIEVKITSNKINNRFQFYITDNEYSKMNADKNYVIYLVSGVETQNPKISKLDMNFIKKNKPNPVLYSYIIEFN